PAIGCGVASPAAESKTLPLPCLKTPRPFCLPSSRSRGSSSMTQAEETMAEQYDVLILGSGQAGNPLSSEFVKAGRRVALIERAEVAGTCINYGCTPTKAMIASAQRAWQARHAGELGIETGPVHVHLDQVRARKRRIVGQFRTSSE